MEKYSDFSFEMVPSLWPVCFISGCPKAKECLRHLAGKHIPADMTSGPSIYPTTLQDGQCDAFRQIRVIHAAWGFMTLFKEVKQKDNTPLREAIKQYLGGHGTYYRYHNGEKLLTPEQQKWIVALFRKYGCTENLLFDHYKDIIDFS